MIAINSGSDSLLYESLACLRHNLYELPICNAAIHSSNRIKVWTSRGDHKFKLYYTLKVNWVKRQVLSNCQVSLNRHADRMFEGNQIDLLSTFQNIQYIMYRTLKGLGQAEMVSVGRMITWMSHNTSFMVEYEQT